MNCCDLQHKLQREIVIFDGAMGTEIYQRNYFINTSFEQLSLTAPEVIADIHRQYAEAGADVLSTNTYNANRRKLELFGLGEQTAAINAAGVRLARRAAGENRLVAGVIGQTGMSGLADPESGARAGAILAEQAALLLDGGADFLIFESLGNRGDAAAAAAAVRQLGRAGLAYVPSFALNAAAEGADGASFEELFALFPAETPPAAVGLNCGNGPEATLATVEKIVPALRLPLIVQPNSGAPRKVDNRTIFLTSPEYFSTYALRYVNLGARGVGGCCGITPAHIKDMARSVKPVGEAASGIVIEPIPAESETRDAVPLARRSGLGAKLAAGVWLKTVEVTPPRGFNLAEVVEKAKICRAAGIDAINLPDGPRASARISPLVVALEIQEKAGIETMLHVCCRDRSLIGLQAELLGCACRGIRNLLFITGDPPKLGDHPFSSGVFDIDAIGLVKMQARLNRGIDLGGKLMNEPTAAVIAVGADPNALDLEREYRRLNEKIEAGAELVITQPVFSAPALLAFLDRIEHLRTPVLAGIWPLASYRNAEFMRNEVPGVVVPDEIMLRMAAVAGREEQRAAGIAIARETLAAIRGRVCGAQVSAPFGNVQTALQVHAD